MNKISFIAAAMLSSAVAVQAFGFGDGFPFGNMQEKIQTKIKKFKAVRNLLHDQRSYAHNEYGIVTADRAAMWINDWESNKPGNVNGRLFVMQVGLLPGEKPFIKHDDVHTFTFDRTAGCTNTGDMRFDGISNIPMPIFAGGMPNGMDGAFWAYDIDPNEDMILVVVASDNPKNLALASRFLWTMNYWGMKKDHIAMMDGTAMYMFDPKLNPRVRRAGVKSRESMFVAQGSEYLMAPGGKLDFGDPEAGRMPAPRTHFKSIKTLPTQPNFSLFASMEDMMNVVDANDKRTVIIDGRKAVEYTGDIASHRSKTETKECGPNHNEQCYTAIEGHIKGAVNLEYTSVINRDDYVKDINGDGVVDEKDGSMTFKSKRELRRMFKKLGVRRNSEVYTYCRTGTRASLLTYVSFEILGYSTHMYDGSWIQWGKMADAVDTYGNQMLPEDSPWRVDITRYTENLGYNDSLYVGPASSRLEPYAPEGSGNRIVEEDEAYRFDFGER